MNLKVSKIYTLHKRPIKESIACVYIVYSECLNNIFPYYFRDLVVGHIPVNCHFVIKMIASLMRSIIGHNYVSQAYTYLKTCSVGMEK